MALTSMTNVVNQMDYLKDYLRGQVECHPISLKEKKVGKLVSKPDEMPHDIQQQSDVLQPKTTNYALYLSYRDMRMRMTSKKG